MHLLTMTIKGWRNYTGVNVNFGPGINLLIGDNGQGKTNLLEAMFFLSSGLSPRAGKVEELINWKENYFYIAGELLRSHHTFKIEMGASRDGRRVNKIDGVPLQRLSDISDYVNAVFFVPEDLYLVKGSPVLRRRFLDIEIGQINSSYRLTTGNYKKFLKERNALLKSKDQDKILLNVLTRKLAELSRPIAQKRHEYIQRLSILARLKHRKLSNNREELSLVYNASANANLSVQEVMDLFKKTKLLEQRYKSTMIGPHRDDFTFVVNGKDLRTYGSQGQQRTAVLSLKLAEIELFKGETGEYPLLLLDDVFSELDEQRKTMLLQDLSGRVQTFISSAETLPLTADIQTFLIESGNIRERN